MYAYEIVRSPHRRAQPPRTRRRKETFPHETPRHPRRAAPRLRRGADPRQPGAAVAQHARAAAAAGAAHGDAARALAVDGDPAAAVARRRADADGKGGAPGAGARQSRPRPRQPAGVGGDLPRHAAGASRRDRAQPPAHAQRRAHRRRRRRRGDAGRRRSLRDGARRPDPDADRAMARAPSRRAACR